VMASLANFQTAAFEVTTGAARTGSITAIGGTPSFEEIRERVLALARDGRPGFQRPPAPTTRRPAMTPRERKACPRL
jgi:hypothetical protein